MATEIDSDRDDITVDTSREAQIRRAVAYVAQYVTGGFDRELSGEEPPTLEQIKAKVRGPEAQTMLRMATSLIWPAWDHDAHGEEPVDFVPLVIERARRICGV